MVTAIQISGNGNVSYGVTWEAGSGFCFDCELTADPAETVAPPVKVQGLANANDDGQGESADPE